MHLGIALLPRRTNARMPDDRELGKSTIGDSDFGHSERGSDRRCCILNWHEPTDLARDANDQLLARECLAKKAFNANNVACVAVCQNLPLKGAGAELRELDANEVIRMSCVHRPLLNQPSYLAN